MLMSRLLVFRCKFLGLGNERRRISFTVFFVVKTFCWKESGLPCTSCIVTVQVSYKGRRYVRRRLTIIMKPVLFANPFVKFTIQCVRWIREIEFGMKDQGCISREKHSRLRGHDTDVFNISFVGQFRSQPNVTVKRELLGILVTARVSVYNSA